MSDQVNGIVLREDFKIAVKIFQNAFNPQFKVVGNQKVPNPNYDADWDPVSAFKLTQSELRLEQPLVTNSTSYLFPILSNIQNQAQQFPCEIRLNLQDSFVPTRLGVYVALPSSTTDTTFKLFTYFNQNKFPAFATEEAFYNGQIKLMIDNKQYLNGWGLQRHRVVNQTQQIAAASTTTAQDQFDGVNDGMYPIQPFVLLLGSANLQLNIQLPAAVSAIDAGARIVLRFEGVLAQNSTSVNG